MFFSVVIPLYNKEDSIVSTLDSVINQTFRDFEIVVVNDGSTDSSAQTVRNYIQTLDVEQMHKVRLLEKTNGGVSSARNFGIMEAEGEYIAFLDGDDLWDPVYLDELFGLIHDFPNAGLYGIAHCEVLDGTHLPNADSNQSVERRFIENPWDENCYFWTGSSSSSRLNLISVGLFDERMWYGEDLDMWYRLLLLGGGAVSSRCLAYYVQGSENRAMHRTIPLEKHIPFFMEKYKDARRDNASFRRFFDKEMVYRLYPYLFDNKYRKEAKRLGKIIDYSQLKWSLHFRMVFPRMYKLYTLLVRKTN